MDIIEIKNFSIFLYEEAQDMIKTWNLLEICLKFEFSLISLNCVNFLWLEVKFPEFSWPSKILFFPDFYLTCGNHEQLNVEYKRGLHCFFLFRSVIGPYNSYHPLNQSHAKRKPKATGSVSFYFFFGFAPLNPNSSNSNFYLEDKRILIVEEAGVVKICVTSFANRNNRAIL